MDGSCNKHGSAVRRGRWIDRQAGGQADTKKRLPPRQTAAHPSRPLAQLPADSGHVSGVGGEPLLAVVQSATLRRVLDTEPQRSDGALQHGLHVPKQDGHSQDQRGCGADNRQSEGQADRRETAGGSSGREG